MDDYILQISALPLRPSALVKADETTNGCMPDFTRFIDLFSEGAALDSPEIQDIIASYLLSLPNISTLL